MINLGFWSCVVLVPPFGILGLLFGIFKEKSVKFISGFNDLPKSEQAQYDRAHMAKDMRNSLFLYMFIMIIGTLMSYFVTPYAAIAAYVIWLILFFKDVHLDARKAFRKYLIQ